MELRHKPVSNCVVAQPKEEVVKDQSMPQIANLIQQEIAKFMASQSRSTASLASTPLANFMDYAGYNSFSSRKVPT
ncbi:hypothetical protein DH2020_045751 [Rehmannia glutinosa]|uniref:Uncharacterized protein n=1 Tax=Rehmannia glutinosa TaxID=99300 RepID=A0ABR0UD85_REHGL